MATEKQNNKAGITPEKAMAWANRKFGKMKDKQNGEKLGVSARTARRYVKDFDEFMQTSEQYQDAIERIVEMLPGACEVYERTMETPSLMGNADVMVATNVFKMAAFMKERTKVEKDITNLSDSELDDLKRSVSKDIAREISDIQQDSERGNAETG